jgi:hypothetical protein
MGFNTTIIILNDALESIAADPKFGKMLRDAVLKAVSQKDCPVRLWAGNSDAGSVIETHHADQDVMVSVGGNTGIVVKDDLYGADNNLVSIKEIAKTLGVSRDRATIIAWGRLGARKMAGRYIVLRCHFDRYVSNLEWEKKHGKAR